MIGIVAGDWQTSSFCWQLLIWTTNVYHQTHSNVHLKVAFMRVYTIYTVFVCFIYIGRPLQNVLLNKLNENKYD